MSALVPFELPQTMAGRSMNTKLNNYVFLWHTIGEQILFALFVKVGSAVAQDTEQNILQYQLIACKSHASLIDMSGATSAQLNFTNRS